MTISQPTQKPVEPASSAALDITYIAYTTHVMVKVKVKGKRQLTQRLFMRQPHHRSTQVQLTDFRSPQGHNSVRPVLAKESLKLLGFLVEDKSTKTNIDHTKVIFVITKFRRFSPQD